MTYVFACGGSGGHIFPALAVGEELERRRRARVFYVCGGRDIESEIFRVLPPAADRSGAPSVFTVESAPFRGALSFADARFLLKLTRGFFQSRALLQKLDPALVVGFGGYVSFPVLLAAKQMGLKTALHEQNVRPGRANRWLGRLVGGVALSFAESEPVFASTALRRVTGNPVRASIEGTRRDEARRFFGFSPGKRTLLVLGGSQGAESINRVFLSSLPVWDEPMKRALQVLHLCGIMLPSEAERACREASVFSRAFSFFERMDLAYGAVDLCLGRAGATFLAEIASKDLPAILVPYPHGDGHQRENARVFAREHLALVVEQSELTPQKLAGYIRDLLGDRGGPRDGAGTRLSGADAGNARTRLADFLEECAR
jgi:UDP-N-acetylglucosamine--N-acetylmuramyl-(pentapeptide) pyrophosphoryl-undecaprenol N-acetylglucosamine transferase